MTMESKMKKIVIAIATIIVGLLCFMFLFGKLFPFSPIIAGFSKYEMPNSIVYVQKGATYDYFQKTDSLIPSVEAFHELKFKRKPELFIFRDSLAFIRRSPSKARFCAFSSGRLIISPWALREAEKGKISLAIYVKHELSHVLILQHKGLFSELRYPKWLLEGIAVYSANQMGTSFYPGKDETYHAIAQGNFLPPFDFKTKREDRVRLDVKYRIPFMYSEFACIVDYLVQNYGKAKFLSYMKSMIRYNNHDKIFKQIYGMDFDKFMLEFKQSVENVDASKATHSL
jgi:hypothetical protein